MMRQVALMLTLAAAALALPMLVSDFWIFVCVEIAVFALYAVSFNLLFGYGGMLAFGHAVFFGIGAYALAMMMKKIGFEPVLAASLAPFIAALAGAIVAYFCVKLSGIYFGMLTFAFQMLVYTIIFKSYSLTGGDDGLSGLDPGGLLGTPIGFYYATITVVAIALYFLWRLVQSPFGIALRALRSNDRKSLSLGVNVALHKWLAIVLAAFFAGLAGALYALAIHSVFPGWLNWTASATPIVMTILGGMHSFLGPVIGAVIYVLLQTILTGVTEYWALFLGAVIILIVMAMPNGVVGLLQRRPHE